MKDRKLASRYAKALLSAVTDFNARQTVDGFLGSLAGHLESSAEFRDVLMDPAVSRDSRKKLLTTLAEGRGLPPQMANFLRTLVDNNRIAALPTIAAVYHEELERVMGIVPAELTTATPLTDEMRQRARTAVEKMTGKQVRLTYRVEPDLMGGAVTRIGSMVYDGSLRNQLDRLRRRMAQD